MTTRRQLGGLVCLGLMTLAVGSIAQAQSTRILTRVFFQDDQNLTVQWADVVDGVVPSLRVGQPIEGFPKLDPARQSLVQMDAASGLLMVGVRDDDDGAYQSGWVLIDTGVMEEEHGDHSHWYYDRPPIVRASVLDDKQGNPAHLYNYGGVFYLANDKNDGYTRLDAAKIQPEESADAIINRATFHHGGAGHITLAVTPDGVGYATRMGRRGATEGEVDITVLQADGQSPVVTTFTVPSAGLHGATANQGKVFFAPSDGVCWVDAEAKPTAQSKPEVHHISLGESEGRPVRTGAFTTWDKAVLFTTGAGPTAAVHILDASANPPTVVRIPVPMAEGNRPAGLTAVRPARQAPVAVVFHDHPAETTAPNHMTLIELDPNDDGQFGDARVAMAYEVGGSRVEGHGGHHSFSVDGDRRRAVFSSPADGTLTLFSLTERRPIVSFAVGGTPTKVSIVGGRGVGK